MAAGGKCDPFGFLVGRGGRISLEATAMEIDGDLEMARIAVAASTLLGGSDLEVQPLRNGVRDAMLGGGQHIRRVASAQFGGVDHRRRAAMRCPEAPALPESRRPCHRGIHAEYREAAVRQVIDARRGLAEGGSQPGDVAQNLGQSGASDAHPEARGQARAGGGAGPQRAGKRAATMRSLLGVATLSGLYSAVWRSDTLDDLPASTAGSIPCCCRAPTRKHRNQRLPRRTA